MQDDRGVRAVLSISLFYSAIQRLLGPCSSRWWIANNIWRLSGQETILDVGCGPGETPNYLPPDVHYIGFDPSEKYIESAKKRHGKQHTFIVGRTSDMERNPKVPLGEIDIILCNGVLHHLEDSEADEVFTFALKALKPGGRLVCIEPTYLIHQNTISRWVTSLDRGCNIRMEHEWKALFSKRFDSYETHILSGLIRIPYIHIAIECTKLPDADKEA